MALISRNLLKRRPQELGKIKIGGKGAERAGSGGKKFRLPVKYDHFVVTSRARGEDGNFVTDAVVHGHPDVGEKPTELAGVLMYETPEQNYHAEMALYRGKTQKVSTCDGDNRTDLGTGKETPCKKAQGGECECKPYGRLHLQLWASGHVMGYHTFRTTSWESVNNIQTALQEIYERFGSLFMAPVKLVMYPSEDQYKADGGVKVSTSWKVGLVLAVSMEDAGKRMVSAKRQLDLARDELKLIAGEVQKEQRERDMEEAEDIAGEFFPEEGTEASVQSQTALEELKGELGVTLDAEYEVVEEGDDAPEGEPLENDPPEENAPNVPEKNGEKKWEARAQDLFGKITDSVQVMEEDEALDTLVKYLRKYGSQVSMATQEHIGARKAAGYTMRKAENDLKKVIWEFQELQPNEDDEF